MAVDEKLIKLAVDAYHGRTGEYSVSDSMEVLRKAFVEANHGKASFNYKDVRDGKCADLFAIVETLIEKISEEGLKSDDMFNQFVEDRNLALGDSDRFHVNKDCLLFVADIADGSQSVRRQRIESGRDVTVETKPRAIKVYEELNRVLSGRIDFNKFIDACGKSFTNDELDEAYTIWANTLKNLTAPYSATGTYNEDTLMDIVAHVEAATGETAIIVGTKKALRKVTTAVVSDEAKSDMYNMGYYGRVNGVNMVMMKQRHKIGSTDFVLDDNMLYIIAGNGQPIKRVTEGDVTMLTGNPMDNADLSQEFLMIKRTGMAVVMDREYGSYSLS